MYSEWEETFVPINRDKSCMGRLAGEVAVFVEKFVNRMWTKYGEEKRRREYWKWKEERRKEAARCIGGRRGLSCFGIECGAEVWFG